MGRVAVTGIGAVTPLGLDVPSTWTAAQAGESGIDWISTFDTDGLPVRVAGEARTVEAPVNYLIDTGVKPVNETGGGARYIHVTSGTNHAAAPSRLRPDRSAHRRRRQAARHDHPTGAGEGMRQHILIVATDTRIEPGLLTDAIGDAVARTPGATRVITVLIPAVVPPTRTPSVAHRWAVSSSQPRSWQARLRQTHSRVLPNGSAGFRKKP